MKTRAKGRARATLRAAVSALIFASIATGIFACAQANRKADPKQCVIYPEQSSLFNGYFGVIPIRIARSGSFQARHSAAISKAAGRWNSYHSTAHGFGLIEDNGTTPSSPPSSPCENTYISGGQQVRDAELFMDGGLNPNIIGLAQVCYQTSTPHPSNGSNQVGVGAMISFNSNHFGAQDNFDFETIASHEMGHMLGLGHSCDDPGGGPSCLPGNGKEFSWGPADLMAALFQFAEIRVLTLNDKVRMNCQYVPL